MKAHTATGTTAKHRILQTTPKVPRWKGKKKTQGKKEQRWTVWLCGTQGNASEQETVKYFVVTEKRLWELHRLLNGRGARDLQGNYEESDARDRGWRHVIRGPEGTGSSTGQAGGPRVKAWTLPPGSSPNVGRIWIRPSRKSAIVGHSTMSRVPV